MMEMTFWQIVNALTALGVLAVAIKQFITDRAKIREAEIKDDGESRSETDVKIKELEGRINTQYSELTTKMVALERSIQDVRLTNSAFEVRVIQGQDRLESKLERLQDLVLKTFINNQTN